MRTLPHTPTSTPPEKDTLCLDVWESTEVSTGSHSGESEGRPISWKPHLRGDQEEPGSPGNPTVFIVSVV